jgi:hypothetical protein
MTSFSSQVLTIKYKIKNYEQQLTIGRRVGRDEKTPAFAQRTLWPLQLEG